jgi:hypothetical protein
MVDALGLKISQRDQKGAVYRCIRVLDQLKKCNATTALVVRREGNMYGWREVVCGRRRGKVALVVCDGCRHGHGARCTGKGRKRFELNNYARVGRRQTCC